MLHLTQFPTVILMKPVHSFELSASAPIPVMQCYVLGSVEQLPPCDRQRSSSPSTRACLRTPCGAARGRRAAAGSAAAASAAAGMLCMSATVSERAKFGCLRGRYASLWFSVCSFDSVVCCVCSDILPGNAPANNYQGSPVRRGLGRRQEHGEDDDDDDVYESRQKRASGGLGSVDKGAIGQSSAYDSHDDAMAATKCVFRHISQSDHASACSLDVTLMKNVVVQPKQKAQTIVCVRRARISAIKDKDFDDDDTAAASINRKKLSDVKVSLLCHVQVGCVPLAAVLSLTCNEQSSIPDCAPMRGGSEGGYVQQAVHL